MKFCIRTDADEDYDKKLYSSVHKLKNKSKIIASLSNPNSTWLPTTNQSDNSDEDMQVFNQFVIFIWLNLFLFFVLR